MAILLLEFKIESFNLQIEDENEEALLFGKAIGIYNFIYTNITAPSPLRPLKGWLILNIIKFIFWSN